MVLNGHCTREVGVMKVNGPLVVSGSVPHVGGVGGAARLACDVGMRRWDPLGPVRSSCQPPPWPGEEE